MLKISSTLSVKKFLRYSNKKIPKKINSKSDTEQITQTKKIPKKINNKSDIEQI